MPSLSTHSSDRGRNSKLSAAKNNPESIAVPADYSAGAIIPTVKALGAGRDVADEIPRRLIHSPREAQILLGISHAQVYRLLKAGRLRAVKIGSRTGITRESIEAIAAGEA